MVTDQFSAILDEIGSQFKIKLTPDANNSCLFPLPNGMQVQMEMDKQREFYVIGMDVGGVPAGRYREDLFRQALLSNGRKPPRNGIFAYSKQLDHLILFEMLPVKNLTGNDVIATLNPMAAKALTWKNAIEKGDIPPVEVEAVSGKDLPKAPMGMFGMR